MLKRRETAFIEKAVNIYLESFNKDYELFKDQHSGAQYTGQNCFTIFTGHVRISLREEMTLKKLLYILLRKMRT